MNSILSVLSIVFFSFSLFAAEPPANGVFSGTLGGKPVKLRFRQDLNSNDVTGHVMAPDLVDLVGKVGTDGTLLLPERRPSEKQSKEGIWEGKLVDGKYVGTWRPKTSQEKIPFQLKQTWDVQGHYSGQMGQKIDIVVWLEGTDTVTGKYFYRSRGQDIKLHGNIESDGTLHLQEFDATGKVNGKWKGILNRFEGSGFSGEWSTPDDKEKFSVELSLVSDDVGGYEFVQNEILNAKSGPGQQAVACQDKPSDPTCKCTLSIGWGTKDLEASGSLIEPTATLLRDLMKDKVTPFGTALCKSSTKQSDGTRNVHVEGFVRTGPQGYLSIIFTESWTHTTIAISYKMPEKKIVKLNDVMDKKARSRLINFMRTKTGAKLTIDENQSFSLAPWGEYGPARLVLYYDGDYTSKLIDQQNDYSATRIVSDEEEASLDNMEKPEIGAGQIFIPPDFVSNVVLKKAYKAGKKE